ncbi:MAG: thiamine pyrophosphate-dependent enzyme [Acidobacteriaceae bacterium]|nr:thiamine pyrophosphate-dependent enzyme [Acidobacteriaceae bacterium]
MAAPARKKKSTARRTIPAPQAPAGSFENPLIPNARLQEIYVSMLRSRLLETKLTPAAQRPAEATGAGLLLNLRNEDTLLSTTASHRMLKGVALKQLVQKRAPRSIDHGAPAQNVLPSIADTTAALYAALGVAFSYKAAAGAGRDSNIVLAYTADIEACLAAARLAELHRLPILFILTHNSSTPTATLRAHRYALPGIPVDRDDAVAVYRVSQEATARARAGGGPTLVECMRYPVAQKQKADAIATMERYLTRKGLFTAAWKRALIAGFRRELAVATIQARKAKKS